MGNYVSPKCCVCEQELKLVVPWAGSDYRTCSWCDVFWSTFAKGNAQLATYNASSYSPLDFENERRGINVRNAFNASTLHVETPLLFNVLHRLQRSADVKDVSGFFVPNYTGVTSIRSAKSAFRHDYAVLPEWNDLQTRIMIAIPKGIQMTIGTAAHYCEYLGGGTQIYIAPEIVKALYAPSCKFLVKPSQEAYGVFMKACAPAFEMQAKLLRSFRQRTKTIHDDAHDHNALKTLHECYDKVFCGHDGSVEARCAAYLRAERFAKQTSLRNPTKNGMQRLQTNNPKYKESWDELKANVLRHRALLRTALPYLDQIGIASDVSLGNKFALLAPRTQALLRKMVAKCKDATHSFYERRDTLECGTYLVHKEEAFQVEVAISFLGTETRGNTTIFKYKVLTVTTVFV